MVGAIAIFGYEIFKKLQLKYLKESNTIDKPNQISGCGLSFWSVKTKATKDTQEFDIS